jgi:hypothetical protein
MIKKLFFTLAFLAVAGWVSAQSLQFEMDGRVFANNEVLICDSEPSSIGELALEMQIRNLTNETIPVVVRKEYVKIVEGTENTFCWGLCFGEPTFESRPVDLGGNAVSMTGELSFHHQLDLEYTGNHDNFVVGTSVVRYYAYPSKDPDNAVCIEVWFAYGAEGVDENKVSFGHAYPNPASSVVRFNYQLPAAGNASVSVYNLLGQEVMNQELSNMQGQAVLSVADLNEGIYFCNLKVNGRAVKTEKFVVKRF